MATKLRAPTGRPGLIQRPRLTALLDQGDRARLTLVVAPSGYGKSVLLSQWVQGRRRAGGAATAWLSLESTDGDPATFTRYVITALRGITRPTFGEAAETLLGVPGSSPESWVTALVGDLVTDKPDLILVLDDFHLLEASGAVGLAESLLRHAPASLHIVVSSRTDPPFSVAALRAAGQLAEIRADELRCSPDEATELLGSVEGLALHEPAVAALTSRTEGWPAGLYLAALWLRGRDDADLRARDFAGDHRHVVDYLIDVVVSRLDPAMRDFLLSTSVVEVMNARLCAALTGETTGDAERQLAEVDRSNLFLVRLDDSRSWYRYHHLFREVLHSELQRRTPDLHARLHRRAARWYVDEGMTTEAVAHAQLAGEEDLAAQLVWGNWLTLGRRGQTATLERWLSGFSEAALVRHPELGIVGGMVVGETGGSLADFRRWLSVAEHSGEATGAPSLLRSHYDFVSLRAATAAGEHALEHDALARGELRLANLANLGQLHYFAGDVAASLGYLEEVLANPMARERPFALITALSVQALITLDAGDAVAGQRQAGQAMRTAAAAGLVSHPVVGLTHVAIGRAFALGQQHARAREELSRGLEAVRGGVLPIREAYALIMNIPAAQHVDNLPLARSLADEAAELLGEFADAGVRPGCSSRHGGGC